MSKNKPLSLEQVAEAIACVDALEFEAKAKRVERIFEDQPAVLGVVVQLHSLGVDYATQEHAIHVLLVLHECFTRHVRNLPRITEEMVQVALDKNVAMHRFFDDETPEEAARLQRLAASQHPEQNVLAFVAGHLSEHLPNYSRENELVIHACTGVMESFVKAKQLARDRGGLTGTSSRPAKSRSKSRSGRRQRRRR